MTRVYIEHGNQQYRDLFFKNGFTLADIPDTADLICFTGGADVTPDLYGDRQHKYTGNDVWRDEKEKRLFEVCLDRGVPMVGICRGGQFLNVMSGGRMYQDVSGHAGDHELVDLFTGETVLVSSTHHQMMMPSEEGTLIAESIHVKSDREWYDNQVFRRDTTDKGVEVVFYEQTKCLCFQPHPEFGNSHYEGMRRYFFSLLKRYLGVESLQPMYCI